MVFKVEMLLTFQRARLVVAVLAVALLCATGSAAADSPVLLGSAGGNSVDSAVPCTAYGFSVAGYTFPYSGILTKYQSTLGYDHTTTAETIRLRTVHSNGTAASAYVASEGAQNSVQAFGNSLTVSLDARVPAAAGDHLAMTTTTGSGGYLGQTHCASYVPSEVGHTGKYDGSTSVGANPTWMDVTGTRPNVAAVLEPDADQDGYGDGSQDLCPDKAAIYFYACTGALYGTNTALTPAASDFACAVGFNCLRVQTSIGGVSTAAPYRGVIVRWRASSNELASMRIRVVKPTDPTHFQVTRSSDPAQIAAAPAPTSSGMPAAMTFVPSRISIDQGDFIGLDIPDGPAVYYGTALPGSNYYDLSNPADGGIVGTPSGQSKQIFYNADIERDADGDGYGDETQDLCPSDATRQIECASTADTTRPIVTKLRVSPKKFRVSTKGAVITKSVPKGTKFKLTLSEKATVTFSVYRIVKTKSRIVHSFKRSGKFGANAFAYSGRYRPQFKTKKLSPGSYKLKVVATDAAGNKSTSRSTTFTIAR